MIKKIIDTIIATIVAFVIFIIPAGLAGEIETHYTLQGTVVQIYAENDEVFVIDSLGHKRSFYGDGFMEGDEVTLKMFNNHTDSTTEDDVIEKARFRH